MRLHGREKGERSDLFAGKGTTRVHANGVEEWKKEIAEKSETHGRAAVSRRRDASLEKVVAKQG